MKTSNLIRSTLAATALSLGLSGCLALDEQGAQEDRLTTAQFSEAGWWILNETGSFVFGEAFGLVFPSDDAVDLSDETLEKIAGLIEQGVRDEWFIQYDSNSKTIYDLADEYYRSSCIDDPRCDDRFVTDHYNEAKGIADDALALLNSYNNSSYRDRRLQVAQHIQNIAAIRLAFLEEIYQLHMIDDNPTDDLLAERSNICEKADDYHTLIGDVADQFEDTFSQPFMKQVSQRNNPGGVILPGSVDREYKGCISGPGDDRCGTLIRNYHQSSTGTITWSGASEQDLLDEAMDLRDDLRTEILGQSYGDVRSELLRIASCDGIPLPQGAVVTFAKVTGDGPQNCPAGYRLASRDDVQANQGQARAQLGNWDIARLTDGWALRGSGYGYDFKQETGGLGHSLCVQ